jgi:hypothetical protein
MPRPPDCGRQQLEDLRGKTGIDGLERVGTQAVLDVLEVPQRERTAREHIGIWRSS